MNKLSLLTNHGESTAFVLSKGLLGFASSSYLPCRYIPLTLTECSILSDHSRFLALMAHYHDILCPGFTVTCVPLNVGWPDIQCNLLSSLDARRYRKPSQHLRRLVLSPTCYLILQLRTLLT